MSRERGLRILMAFAGGTGHLEPLVPLARAARDAGHTVAFVGRPWMAPRVRDLGFDALSAGSDEGLEPVTRPLVPIDMARELRDLQDGFVRTVGGERARELPPIVEAFGPDVVVWEETDFGAGIVAERLDLPRVVLTVTAAGSFVRRGTVGPALDALRQEHGLPADPDATLLERDLVLSPFPASFRDPAIPIPTTLQGIRLHEMPAGREGVARPAWAGVLPDRPSIYVTLGTIFNHESGDLFPRVLTALRRMDANVLVTIGRELDPAALAAQPPNITIERFVPQRDILPFADLVVSHAGSGSVLGALAHGVPMVLLPMGADQPLNAARCEATGVGRSLDAVTASADTIRAAIEEVQADPRFRGAAKRLQDELAALPSPNVAVRHLERLVAERPATTA